MRSPIRRHRPRKSAARVPYTMRCRRLEVVDARGRVRLCLRTTPEEGSPWISFHGRGSDDGELLMGIYPGDGTPFICLWGRKGYTLLQSSTRRR